MEEWVEHCQRFAYDAWGDINVEVAELAAFETFCTGALDSEAVLPVLEKDPSILDDALELLKRSVHNHHSVNTRSRSSQKTVHSVSFASDSLSAVDIHPASIVNSPSNSIKSSTDPTAVIQKVESNIKDLKTTMAETQEQKAKLMELLKQRSSVRFSSPNGPCYHCNEVGHITCNCPKLHSPSPSLIRDSTSSKPVNM